MAQRNLIAYVLKGGGVRSWVAALTALALTAGALLALAPATAQDPVGVPPGLEFQLQLVDDSDNIVQADSTISVSGRLRLEPGTNLLRIAEGALQLSGAHDWEASGRSRLALPDPQNLLPALEQGDEITANVVQPPADVGNPLGNNEMLRVLAWDGDTIIGRAGPGNTGGGDDNTIYVFRASTGEQVGGLYANIAGPATTGRATLCAFGTFCSTDANRVWGWGRANDDNTGSAVAVWQEDEDTAWLFVGQHYISWYDNSYVYQKVGALYIYEIDYGADPVAITQRREVRVSGPNEPRSKGTYNGVGQDYMTHYGAAVAISADGSTLAVGAPRMHDVGAVYVYTRPTGGWGAALGWNDAVRVSPVVIPAWGDAANERPFEPQSSTDGPGGGECDAYCRSVSSYVGDVDDRGTAGHADFGAYVALSADGGVLAVSAPAKRFASDRAAGTGSFRGGLTMSRHGELLVFLEPAGGWSSVPNYKTETDPDRTEIAWNASAANFDETMHYGTGPDKRVNAPDWKFSFDWSDVQNHWLGERLALSQDGTTLAASDRHNDAVQMFQVSSPSGWAAGPTAPSAQITGVEDGGRWGGFGFNVDGARFALGDPTYDSPAGVSNQGRVLIFRRPADGSWADAAAADAGELLPPTTPTNRQINNERYGRSLAWNLHDRAALAVGAGEVTNVVGGGGAVGPGRLWTLTILPGCDAEEARSVIDGVTHCHLDLSLGDTSIVIPPGSRDGTFTISGTATVVYGADAEGQPLSAVRRADLELRIGEVDEVTELKLGRATDDRGTADPADDGPYPAAIADGETTTLLVQVLNENGAASAANSVSLVSLRTPVGELSTEVGGGCRGGNGGLSCIIEGSALTANNSDKILVTLRHAGTPGAAELTAAVYTPTGEQLNAEPLSISLTGAPTALAIAQPPTGLLGIDTPDEGDELETVDNRDLLTLSVSAADANGAWVAVPGSAPFASLTGPDGSRVTRGVALDWPLLDDAGEVALDSERNRQVRINVNRGAGDPLANGEYTLSVRSGGLTATQTFSVSGGAARVELSEPSAAPAIGEQFTITATIRDAEGAAVPNGTRVRWEGNAVGETPVLVQIGAEIVTTDGQASSTWLGVDTGRAHIRATADSVTEVQLLNIAASQSAPAAATTPRRLADSLSAPTPGALVSWLGAAGTTASALLADLDNVSAILGWRNGAWLSYSVSGGRPIPGSTDFAIRLGDVLWLGD